MASLSVIRPAAARLSANVTRVSPAVSQTRGYAAPVKPGSAGKGGNNAAAMRTKNKGFRVTNNGGAPGGKAAQKSGVFFPLSAGARANPAFEADGSDELNLLPTFHAEALTSDKAGVAMKFPMAETDPIRVFGLPKNLIVEFRVLSKPCSVVRDVTLNVLERLDAASQTSSANTRIVLTGKPGSGKSFTLVQAVQYASSNNWIVFYFPRAINTVNSTTAYVYDARTRTYVQSTYAYQTLHRFLTVNSAQLKELTTSTDITVEKKPMIPKGTPLTELITLGVKDQTVAPTVLSTVLEELGKQTKYPVLMAVDDFQSLYCKSAYRDPQFERINSYHLSMPRLLLEYASGKKTFNKGAFIGAISNANTEYQAPVELQEALDISPGPNSPYLKRSSELVSYAAGLTKVVVPDQLNLKEASSLFEVWMKDRALVGARSDETFMTKYTEAAGNPRAFVWKGLLASLSTV